MEGVVVVVIVGVGVVVEKKGCLELFGSLIDEHIS